MSDQRDEPTDPAVAWVTDLLYTGVGLGVLAVNRLQVARRDLQKQVDADELELPDLSVLRDFATDPESARRIAAKLRDELQDLDDRLDGIEHRIGSILAGIEPDLPEPLRDVSRAVRIVAEDHVAQLRAVLGLEAR
ncbi:MAG: hypothetical protein AAF480_03165 [Actinomycetota bacterium]